MIVFSRLGNYGRHGNQMFQYAATYATAKELGVEAYCPLSTKKVTLSYCFELGGVKDMGDIESPVVADNMYLEKDGHAQIHDKEMVKSIEPVKDSVVDLVGYFQSEKYFEKYKSDIIREFTFKEPIVEAASKIFKDVTSGGKVVSLHVRRTDYTMLSAHHPLMTKEYWDEALEHFPDHEVLISSDDVEWCMDNFVGDRYTFTSSIMNDIGIYPDIDMCLMTMCDGNIIANSSFSWWGAWLNQNENKKVVAPKTWFGPKGNKEWPDIYCEGWYKC